MKPLILRFFAMPLLVAGLVAVFWLSSGGDNAAWAVVSPRSLIEQAQQQAGRGDRPPLEGAAPLATESQAGAIAPADNLDDPLKNASEAADTTLEPSTDPVDSLVEEPPLTEGAEAARRAEIEGIKALLRRNLEAAKANAEAAPDGAAPPLTP